MATTTSSGARVTISHLRLCDDSWWELAWTCSDPDHFRFIVAAVKAIPPQRRSYDATRKVWRVASAGLLLPLDVHIPGLAQQVRAIMNGAEPRTVASTLPAEVAAAYNRLHLLPSAPRALVEASRRVLARQYHPDHGGDAGKMVAVNTAADAVLAWVDHRASTTHHRPDPSPPSGPSHRHQRASAGRRAAA